MTTNQKPQQESWVNDFQTLFGKPPMERSGKFNYTQSHIKVFISDLISTERTKLLAEIKEVVWGMGFKDPAQAGQFRLHADGYNQALEDVLSAIEKLQETT